MGAAFSLRDLFMMQVLFPCIFAGISSKPSSRKEDETLTKFIRALKSASMSDAGDGMGILSLNGSSFPDHKDFKRTSLLVLDFYPKLLDRVSSMNDSLLTGVPGTGKASEIFRKLDLPVFLTLLLDPVLVDLVCDALPPQPGGAA